MSVTSRNICWLPCITLRPLRNIKKYLLAALYNAPATIDSYYTSLVSHDMYGSGERR